MSSSVSAGTTTRAQGGEGRPGGQRRLAGVATLAEHLPRTGQRSLRGGRVFSHERWLARRILRALGDPPIALVLWDALEVRSGEGPLAGRVLIHDRRTLLKLLAYADLYFGDAYTAGTLDVQGDLVELLEAVYRSCEALEAARPRRGGSRPAPRRAPHSNTPAQSRENIHHHYDIGEDFYRLWLDKELVYTCAYFPSPEATLEEAQAAKMDLVCRKLWLRPGETVVEAGCGWGALALYMARHYGVTVKAFNVSHEQIRYAQACARGEGLDSRVEFIEDDYRAIRGHFDVFASVGMLEHVGTDHYAELSGVIDRCLGPVGRGMIHTIGRDTPGPVNAWIERRIFPGSYVPTLGEMAAIFEPAALSVLDVENLRLHYALTLRHWLARFEASAAAVAEMFDERFVRAWRLYLAGSIAGFTTGSLQLFQVLFARHAVAEIPWTRQRLHAGR